MDDKKEGKTCEKCLFSIGYGESVQYTKCSKSRRYVDKAGTCKDWAPRE